MCFHSQHSRVDLRQKAVMHEAVVEEMGDKTLVVNYYTYQECTARWKTVQEYILPSTRAPRPGISSVSALRPMRAGHPEIVVGEALATVQCQNTYL